MPLSIHPPDAHEHPLRRVLKSMAYASPPGELAPFTHNLQRLYPRPRLT